MQSLVKTHTLALIGNPNSGKSSIFNYLTGLQQKVGNFPGVTVDKKEGNLKLHSGETVKLIDMPGTYSLYPNSKDERIVVQTLTNALDNDFPDAIIYVADVTKLDKHFLLLSQIKDLGLPTLLVLNMADLAEKEGIEVNTDKIKSTFGIPTIIVSGRTGAGMEQIKDGISLLLEQPFKSQASTVFYTPSTNETKLARSIQTELPHIAFNEYQALLIVHHYKWLPFLNKEERAIIEGLVQQQGFQSLKRQVAETMGRFDNFSPAILNAIKKESERDTRLTNNIDQVVTHPWIGPFLFFLIMLLVFQAIFSWAGIPMDAIDGLFAWVNAGLRKILPEGWLLDLLTDGFLAGLGGILIFIPQIALLFFLIAILEEVGYMARAAFIFDRLMQFFGLNGKSIVALISGGACAIPAIMSTRTISNWKERLITIMVTPLISCSARIPVYAVLIGFVVPPVKVLGIFNLQALAFMGLYILGILAALVSALVFKLILKNDERSFLILELPEYRLPVIRNVGITVWNKVKSFVVEAGQVILVISLVLWLLAYTGPGNQMEIAATEAATLAETRQLDEQATANLIASKELEASYIGHIGKFIEPVIQPLGFDWKIGIALVTSFAAREVFVGTMATIYSIGSEEEEGNIRKRMAAEINPATGEPIYTLATSLSLLIFYVFAMQCMSTLAVVKKETMSWKWPIIQLLFMSALAYLGSLLVYQLFS